MVQGESEKFTEALVEEYSSGMLLRMRVAITLFGADRDFQTEV